MAAPRGCGTRACSSRGLPDPSIWRPYGQPDRASLAAGHGVGLTKYHAFVDGHKRAAFLAMCLFLGLNGLRLVASQADAALTMLAVAAGTLDEAQLAARLRRKTRRRGF
jgi:death on curing protein